MDYISTWGYCYCHFKWEDSFYEENKNIFDASEHIIYECVAMENDMLVIQYGEERVQIPPPSYEIVDTPRYKLGEEVYIPRREENGKIIDMDWHFKNQDHMYFLEINGKKYSRRYYENELRKL